MEDSADDPVEDGDEEDVGDTPEMLPMQLLKKKKYLPDKEVRNPQIRLVYGRYAQMDVYVLDFHLLCT